MTKMTQNEPQLNQQSHILCVVLHGEATMLQHDDYVQEVTILRLSVTDAQ